MKTISTGQPSTLGVYLGLAMKFFGLDSPAVEYLKGKVIEEGLDAEVLADEVQMVEALRQLHRKKYDEQVNSSTTTGEMK